MNKLPWLLLLFALAFAAFIVGPAFLGIQFAPYPLLKVGDVLDLLTPLVLIPLYWLLLQSASAGAAGLRAGVPFVLLSALWVEGQGLHLGANSIGHLLEGASASAAFTLTYFYDEVLSHYLWQLGIIGLSALLVLHAWRTPPGVPFRLGLPAAAGALHGFTFFLIVVEGGTAPLGVPFALLFGDGRGCAGSLSWPSSSSPTWSPPSSSSAGFSTGAVCPNSARSASSTERIAGRRSRSRCRSRKIRFVKNLANFLDLCIIAISKIYCL